MAAQRTYLAIDLKSFYALHRGIEGLEINGNIGMLALRRYRSAAHRHHLLTTAGPTSISTQSNICSMQHACSKLPESTHATRPSTLFTHATRAAAEQRHACVPWGI